MSAFLQNEILARTNDGNKPLQLKEITNKLKSIGYKLDRSMDCRGIARYMTGLRAGVSYPTVTTGVVEIDTGRSAFHFEARRDENFATLQDFRSNEMYAVVRGAILEF